MKDNFLVDTNSLLNILKAGQYRKLGRNCHLLDLTSYEYGNAVLNLLANRRNSTTLSQEETMTLLQAYDEISRQMTVLDSRNHTSSLPEIFDLARKENLTFYDASYLYCCMRYRFSLITDDERLLEAARRSAINAQTSDKWLYK